MDEAIDTRDGFPGLIDDRDRYHRQSLITWWDQDRLRRASVLVVGAGALGNEIVKNLVLVGVGTVVVVDMDVVENSNLARCVFFRPEDEGRPKAEVLAARASELNAEVEILALVGDVRLTVGLSAFREFDLVIGGLDNREARLFVNRACWKTGTPWIDGAIEGLMGAVKVFEPPDTPCYECTLGELDHELMAARRTCAMLTREEMVAGRTPTTATSSSVVAAIQSQEAIKLLHRDRLGTPALAGAGYQFVGLTHDSYVVRYTRREDCLSHDTYDLAAPATFSAQTSLGTMLEAARSDLGPNAILELEHELVTAADCKECGHHEPVFRPVDALGSGAGLCSRCGHAWRLEFTHTVDDGSPLCEMSYGQLGLPGADVVVARDGLERRFYSLTGTTSALDVLRDAGVAA